MIDILWMFILLSMNVGWMIWKQTNKSSYLSFSLTPILSTGSCYGNRFQNPQTVHVWFWLLEQCDFSPKSHKIWSAMTVIQKRSVPSSQPDKSAWPSNGEVKVSLVSACFCSPAAWRRGSGEKMTKHSLNGCDFNRESNRFQNVGIFTFCPIGAWVLFF